MVKNKENYYKVKCENGYYLFKLETLLKQMNASKYALSKDTDMDYKIINRYITGDISRFDSKVIARICDFCNCNLKDIIDYVPNKK